MSLSKGDEVNTPDGKGKVAYVRYSAPDYANVASVSVVLDSRRNEVGYAGTIYPAVQVYAGAIKRFVCLQNVQTHQRFFSNNAADSNPTKLTDGTVAYKILGYCNTVGEAQMIIYGKVYNA